MSENSDSLDAVADSSSSDQALPYLEGLSWKREGKGLLASRIADILLSENLIVLTGLGTSLCLRDPLSPDDPSKSRAPRMRDLWRGIQSEYERSVEKSSTNAFQAILHKVRYEPAEGQENVEHLLSHCQLYVQLNSDPSVNEFIRISEMTIRNLCSFAIDEDSLRWHKAFLLKVGRRSTRQPRMKLFTTNYDRCFEEAANLARFVVIDGFSHTIPQQFDPSQFSYDFVRRDHEKDIPDYIPNVFHLYKLHGSIDWELEPGTSDGVVKKANPERPAMIFPRQGKFEASYRQPYFEMMARFQSALRQPKTGLLIIGFGFNDDHISQPIRSALNSNVGLKCCVVNPAFRGDLTLADASHNRTLTYIERLGAEGDRRIPRDPGHLRRPSALFQTWLLRQSRNVTRRVFSGRRRNDCGKASRLSLRCCSGHWHDNGGRRHERQAQLAKSRCARQHVAPRLKSRSWSCRRIRCRRGVRPRRIRKDCICSLTRKGPSFG